MNYIFSRQEEQRGGNSIDVTSKGTEITYRALGMVAWGSTPAMNFFPCQDLIDDQVQCHGNEKCAMPKVRGLQHFWKRKVISWWMTLWERSKTPFLCYFFLIHSAISSTSLSLSGCMFPATFQLHTFPSPSFSHLNPPTSISKVQAAEASGFQNPNSSKIITAKNSTGYALF